MTLVNPWVLEGLPSYRLGSGVAKSSATAKSERSRAGSTSVHPKSSRSTEGPNRLIFHLGMVHGFPSKNNHVLSLNSKSLKNNYLSVCSD